MKKHIPFLIFLIVFIAVGISVYRDYGVSWDEQAQMDIGKVNYTYVTKGTPTLLTFKDRYYGPLFETPLWRLTVKLPNPEMIYARHLVIFFSFVAGLIFLYLLAYALFRNPWWSLLVSIFLALSPRLFANSFYNSKDIPFLTFITLGFLLMVILIKVIWNENRWFTRIIFGAFTALACAFAVDVRLPGMILIPITLFLLLFVGICRPGRWNAVAIILAEFLVLSSGFTILFWPILWHDPVHEFFNAFINMSHFPWGHVVLYRGQLIEASSLPWHYIPTWISMTTPLLQIGAFFLGLLSLFFIIGKWALPLRPITISGVLKEIPLNGLIWMGVLGWLFLPLAVFIILHSVGYDAWRQMFFLYPALLLIGVFGMKTIYDFFYFHFPHKFLLKGLTVIILLSGFSEPIIFSLRYHPFENVYFNVFAGNPTTLRQRFDLDYWGVSYKQGIDYILAHDNSQKIFIADTDLPQAEYIQYMLPPDQASRLEFAPLNKSEYFVTTFRYHPQDYDIGSEYYSVNVNGAKIMTVYSLK